jgi:hypothetical protein
MANNTTISDTPADTSLTPKSSGVSIAIILPVIFALVLVILVVALVSLILICQLA